MDRTESKLSPGFGFKLQPDGSWKVSKIPGDVIDSAEFSGFLTIKGYRCSVFETPDKDQWAQKSLVIPEDSGVSHLSTDASQCCRSCASFAWHGPIQTPIQIAGITHHPSCPDLLESTSIASRVAARFLESKNRKRDVTSIVKKIMGRPGQDQNYEKEITKYGKKIRKMVPKAHEAFKDLLGILDSMSEELSTVDHPKISEHHSGIVRDDIDKAISTVRIASDALLRNLKKRADEWDPED
jgi:hypothetical protein